MSRKTSQTHEVYIVSDFDLLILAGFKPEYEEKKRLAPKIIRHTYIHAVTDLMSIYVSVSFRKVKMLSFFFFFLSTLNFLQRVTARVNLVCFVDKIYLIFLE